MVQFRELAARPTLGEFWCTGFRAGFSLAPPFVLACELTHARLLDERKPDREDLCEQHFSARSASSAILTMRDVRGVRARASQTPRPAKLSRPVGGALVTHACQRHEAAGAAPSTDRSMHSVVTHQNR